MANDINSINSAKTQQSNNRSATRIKNEAADGGTGESRQQSETDTVSLTSTASKMRDIERSLKAESPVNAQRVQAMRQAIDNGEYRVDSDRVADKMIDFESSFRR